MQMRVMDERLSPGVQDGEEADGGPEVFRIGGDGPQRLGGRSKEDPIDHRLILQGDLGDGLGHREHDVKVFGVEQVRGAARWPGTRPAVGVALGTSPGPKPSLSGFPMRTSSRSDFRR